MTVIPPMACSRLALFSSTKPRALRFIDVGQACVRAVPWPTVHQRCKNNRDEMVGQKGGFAKRNSREQIFKRVFIITLLRVCRDSIRW